MPRTRLWASRIPGLGREAFSASARAIFRSPPESLRPPCQAGPGFSWRIPARIPLSARIQPGRPRQRPNTLLLLLLDRRSAAVPSRSRSRRRRPALLRAPGSGTCCGSAPGRSRWRTAWLHRPPDACACRRITARHRPITARNCALPASRSPWSPRLPRPRPGPLVAWPSSLSAVHAVPAAGAQLPAAKPGAALGSGLRRSRPSLAPAPTPERPRRSALTGWRQPPELVTSNDLPCRGLACYSARCMADCSAVNPCATAGVSRCFHPQGPTLAHPRTASRQSSRLSGFDSSDPLTAQSAGPAAWSQPGADEPS